MKITIGIDIGGSRTKIIGIESAPDGSKNLKSPMLVISGDPVASLFGAFGKFIDENSLVLSDVEKVVLTGVGASFASRQIFGLPSFKAPEFLAIGRGGLYLSGLGRALIVSMGTGTALVLADGENIVHIGGSGVGGGTIMGLSGRLLNIRDIDIIAGMASSGDLGRADLLVSDLVKDGLPGLPPSTTASNFGRVSDIATPNDLALGLFNMVYQTIGIISAMYLKNTDINHIVLTGSLTKTPCCAGIFDTLSKLYGVRFIIPEYAEYATALGAALCQTPRNGTL